MAASSPSSPTLLALPKNIGRYDIVRLVGEGAMGRVVLAHDPVLGRDVALKILRDDLKIPEDVRLGLVVRMRHEARAAARVMHPNIVTLHDLGEDDQLGLYLVFEYVEGPTLKRRLGEGALTPAQVARLARELGGALSCAHRVGVVHRDVKPENVILSSTGGKIADFGIARVPDSTLTHAGGLLGTPAYSAPETFHDGKFSPESDQFSLAASLYEALSGRRAFPGEDAVAVASSIATQVPRRFAVAQGLSPVVDDVLLRAMSKEPTGRFASCEEFGGALSKALVPTLGVTHRADPVQAMPPMTEDDLRPPRRVGQIAIGGVVVVVTALLLLRTALRSADSDDIDGPAARASATATGSAARGAPLATPMPTTNASHRPRPKTDATAHTDADGGVAPGATSKPAGSGEAAASPAPGDAPEASRPDAGR